MGKLYNELQKQLGMPEYKQDAENCVKIYDKFKRDKQWQRFIE